MADGIFKESLRGGQDKDRSSEWAVDYLYENKGSGALGIGSDGKAFRQYGEDSPLFVRPSLAGPQPSFGRTPNTSGAPRGIGGSEVPYGGKSNPVHGQQGMLGNVRTQSGSQVRSEPKLTPDQMMKLAKRMEQEFLDRMASEEKPAVQPTLDRTSSFNPTAIDGEPSDGQLPGWLTKYMDEQEPSDPFQMKPPSKVDIVASNQYLSEREKLKLLKQMEQEQGLR